MGANNSTRRVSFESDENENISVVKGIRLSENVIKRMREPEAPPKQKPAPASPPTPPPTPPPPSLSPPIIPPSLLRPVPPLFDPITSMPPPPPPLVEPVAPPPSPPPPPPSPPTEQSTVEPASPASVPEPVAAPESSPVAPPVGAPAVDEEALRKRITTELYKDLEQERAKAEKDLQAWLEAEKARASTQAQAEARSHVQDEVSRILSVERAVAQESLQQAIVRERIATEDEKIRAQLFTEIGQKAKQLEAREADLKKQDAFYREQVARLEERSAQFYKVTTENYHKAADDVNAKFRRYEVYPVCADLQGQILACYKENAGKTLNCSNIAALYLQCVNNTKQNDKFVFAPSWTDDTTS